MKLVKFLHTADWQMGMKALGAGERAKQVRERRYDAARKVVQLAKNEKVEFMVISGDLFENHDVDETVVKRTVSILNEMAPLRVFVLPGNHDPLTPGSVWTRSSWSRRGNHILLLEKAEEYILSDGVALYPCPLRQKRSGLDPTDWIPTKESADSRIRIGVAHGALRILPQNINFPIAQDRAEICGLDYLALGDWHGFSEYGKAVYSGTFEQTSFSERNAGKVLIVEIASSGGPRRITPIPIGTVRWLEVEHAIGGEADLKTLEAELRQLGSLKDSIIRLNTPVRSDLPRGCTEDLGRIVE
ncbi:MAG: metallophosphoesterase family protein, partial [bacterium]